MIGTQQLEQDLSGQQNNKQSLHLYSRPYCWAHFVH